MNYSTKIRFLFITFFIAIFIIPFQAKSAVYRMPAPGNDIIGQSYITKVKPGDSSTTLRQRYEISLEELIQANPKINFDRLKVGKKIIIPTQFILPKFRRGIVINTAELRLYYFTPDGQYVYTFPVGLGRQDWRTPATTATVVNKVPEPTWNPPESVREYMFETHGKLFPESVPPGPENPLGHFAIYLNRTGYVIHGTNDPDSVGTFASSGCIRLLAESIEALYNDVNIGTSVYIIHHPNKAGWLGNKLYLESQKPVSQYDENTPLDAMDVDTAIAEAIAGRGNVQINWTLVREMTDNPDGIPRQIGGL